jgi:hypothetical protein
MPASMIVLIAMTVIVATIAVYRWIVTHKEDDFLHVIDDPSGQLMAHQQATTRALSQVDRLGIGLTIVTALYGVGLLAMYLFAGLMK